MNPRSLRVLAIVLEVLSPVPHARPRERAAGPRRQGRLGRTILVSTALATAALAAAESSFAQTQGGWILTPSLVYSGGWDDNVLIKGEGDQTVGDLLHVVNPHADIGFTGRRGQLSVSYDGAFQLYRAVNTLNSYDQRGSVSVRRRTSPKVTLFARNGFAFVPTTATEELVGVPFVRTGSTIDDFQTGLEAALTKHTTMAASYDFQWVQFDEDPAFSTILRGGHSNGASVSLRHALSDRTAAVADYRLQHALVSGTDEMFFVQNWGAGFDHRLSEHVRMFAMAGVSRLSVSAFGPPRTGPSIRAGVSRQFQQASADLSYGRSFIPSYGFGGTTQNEELTAGLNLPLTRRLDHQSSVALRRNEPLTVGEQSLLSLWLQVSIGYALHPSLRIQGFYARADQVIDRAGGVTHRNRFGFQLLTSRPVRIR
jgi:hypothetical protein